jgi:hypothetical protein
MNSSNFCFIFWWVFFSFWPAEGDTMGGMKNKNKAFSLSLSLSKLGWNKFF